MKKTIATLSLIGLHGACGVDANYTHQGPVKTYGLSEAQSCAVGFDLSKQIYERVSLRQTTLIPSKSNKNTCEAHMERYLMKAGYRLDPSLKGEGMQVAITRLDQDTFSARATITGGLVISRKYQTIRGGVRAISAPSIIQIPVYADSKGL